MFLVVQWELDRRASLPSTLSRTRTMSDLQEPCVTPTNTAQRRRGSVKRCVSQAELGCALC